MKKTKLTFLTLFTIIISLTGCRENYSHEYLLSHPEVVQTELMQCRKSSEYNTYCDMVKHTADEFEALINVRASDPEAFGKQIMQTEVTCLEAKENLQKIRQEYQQLKTNHPQDATLNDLQNKLQQAKQDYEAQKQKVSTLLAVVASMSMGSL